MTARSFAAVAFFAAITLAVSHEAIAHSAFAGDFRAFYCAGELARHAVFSYSEPAIAACEQRAAGPWFFTASASLVYPAPLPGYAVALFVPLSLLSFGAASLLWSGLAFFSAIGIAALLTSLRIVSFDAAILALSVPMATIIIPTGELPWIALAGIAILATGISRERRSLRIAGLACICTEPQLAIGTLVMLCALHRRYVADAAVVAIALIVLSATTIGVQNNVFYVTQFLPSHVAAETIRAQQYGVPWIVAQLGASVQAAQWTGRVVFALALVLTVVVTRRLARTGDAIGACVVAPAFALLGGPFVHEDHLLCAIPAAVWLASWRPALGIPATIVLALPIEPIFAQPLLLLTVPIVTVWFTAASGAGARTALYAALGAISCAAILAFAAAHFGLDFERGSPSSHGVWASYVAQHDVVRGWVIWLIKSPVWITLVALGIAASAPKGFRQNAPAAA